MADEVDMAQQHMERELALLLASRRREAVPEASGECHWCGEGVAPPRRWCDADCRTAWERDRAARARRGSDTI